MSYSQPLSKTGNALDERIAGKLREAETEAAYRDDGYSLEDSKARVERIRVAVESLPSIPRR